MNRAFFYILLGAVLWGTIGWYVKNLYYFGFTPMEVVTLRVVTTAFLLVAYVLLTSPKSLKLRSFSDVKYFIGTGIFSIIFFNYCLFTAIELSTIPFATALLYTAPAFVTIFSIFLFNEKPTRRKLISLVITFIGICLIVKLIPFSKSAISLGSILFGLGSGLGYACYSIFSKYALNKYSSLSITTFTFIVASIVLLPFFPYEEKFYLVTDPPVLFYVIGLGLLPTALAYIVYTTGLNQTEASKASILTTIEPVVATLIGILVFQEVFTKLQILGLFSIICAVISIKNSDNS
ncbi:DMT family transporter [Virgibacillus flavescens]|uniref:DMT family transporter n=1 Tax=Virgibacillus flavescens TaxID=1611422 RepID=UPI003D3279DB